MGQTQREIQRRYRKNHPDIIRAQRKRYLLKHPDVIKAQKRRYYLKYKTLINKKHLQYQKTHAKKIYEINQRTHHQPKNRCVYSLTCTTTGRIYIGSSICIHQRKANLLYRLRVGTHPSNRLQTEFNKYGEKNFQFKIIAHLGDVTEIDVRRREQQELNKIPKEQRINKYAVIGKNHRANKI